MTHHELLTQTYPKRPPHLVQLGNGPCEVELTDLGTYLRVGPAPRGPARVIVLRVLVCPTCDLVYEVAPKPRSDQLERVTSYFYSTGVKRGRA